MTEVSNTQVRTQDAKDLSSIENWFTYHETRGNQLIRYKAVRGEAKQLAACIVMCVPPGPDRTVALRKLREVVMVANAAIACDDNVAGERSVPLEAMLAYGQTGGEVDDLP